MSGSQEAAHAARMLADMRDRAKAKVDQLSKEIHDLRGQQERALQALSVLASTIEAKNRELQVANREYGNAAGQYAAFNGPVGYGGAPATSGLEPTLTGPPTTYRRY